jgi:hypothetical protein
MTHSRRLRPEGKSEASLEGWVFRWALSFPRVQKRPRKWLGVTAVTPSPSVRLRPMVREASARKHGLEFLEREAGARAG